MANEVKEPTPAPAPVEDEDTIHQSGNSQKINSVKRKPKKAQTIEEKYAKVKAQIAEEKAGKRKLFHSLVKLANELRRVRTESSPLVAQRNFEERPWYKGGIWRSPTLLPFAGAAEHHRRRSRSPALSLSSLFFSLVVVTGLTRVGVVISQNGNIDVSQTFYFAIFISIWMKESSYSTRFDTSDLSSTVVTLVTCFAVLFATLSVPHPMDAPESSTILICAAFCAGLHALLHIRVAVTGSGEESDHLSQHVAAYAMLNMILCTIEMVFYLVAVFVFDASFAWRWALVLAALVSSIRMPRAFLANDFHAACSQRNVLFILLLGFLLQSVVVVASEFFEYESPTVEEYSFFAATCLLFFCIKLLYVDDDSDTLTVDHALLVNRTAGFFFNVGQFSLLLATTVMGSGLNNLTHEYLAATAALPGPSKQMVCGGFASVLLSILFVKSMHRKRVPTSSRARALFVAAYVVQTIATLGVAGIAMYLASVTPTTGWLGYIMQSDAQLLWALSAAALVAVLMSWLDEAVELALYSNAEDASAFRVHPFGFWWCLKPEISPEEMEGVLQDDSESTNAIINSDRRLSQLSPLLGSSLSEMRNFAYDSVPRQEV